MATYVPSGKVGGAGLAATIGASLVAGLLLAVVVHFVGRLFYLILVFPFAWGLGVGAAASLGVRLGKCRNVSFAVIAAVVGAVGSYGAFHALENWHVRSEFKKLIAAEGVEDVDGAYREFLTQKYGSAGFEGELKMRSEFGMSIGRAGRGGDHKPMISGAGMYVYWLVELGIIAFIATAPAKAQAKSLFCEPCEAWYQRRRALGISLEKGPAAAAALEKGDWPALASCVGSGGELSLEKCPSCEKSDIGVILELVTTDEKGKESRQKVHESLLGREAANAMLAATAKPKAPLPPPPPTA
jgi:hypothetical protein